MRTAVDLSTLTLHRGTSALNLLFVRGVNSTRTVRALTRVCKRISARLESVALQERGYDSLSTTKTPRHNPRSNFRQPYDSSARSPWTGQRSLETTAPDSPRCLYANCVGGLKPAQTPAHGDPVSAGLAEGRPLSTADKAKPEEAPEIRGAIQNNRGPRRNPGVPGGAFLGPRRRLDVSW